jgi:hypothetical protein
LTPTPDEIIKLGTVKDIRMLNIATINPAEEFTVDGVTWKCFPMTRKSSTGAEESDNIGIAYAKIA